MQHAGARSFMPELPVFSFALPIENRRKRIMCRRFEAVSQCILERNSLTVIRGREAQDAGYVFVVCLLFFLID